MDAFETRRITVMPQYYVVKRKIMKLSGKGKSIYNTEKDFGGIYPEVASMLVDEGFHVDTFNYMTESEYSVISWKNADIDDNGDIKKGQYIVRRKDGSIVMEYMKVRF